MPHNNSTPASTDRLLGGRVIIRQPEDGYRTAIDPVLLAAAVSLQPGERLLDAGCGTGAASLCLAARVAGADITGIDTEPEFIDLARDSAELNDFAPSPVFEVGDLQDYRGDAGFDHVMTNPPYRTSDSGHPPAHPLKRAANVEGALTLDQWIDACFRLLRPGGRFTMIHSRERMDEVRALIAPLVLTAVIHPLWPKRRRKGCKRFLIQALTVDPQSSSIDRGGVHMAEGLVLHQPDGSYTEEADEILKSGAGFGFDFP
jgi:tRNA1(Val) A37 N6-methylase TrmN6